MKFLIISVFRLFVLNVINMKPNWKVSDENTHTCYKVVVNGISHFYTDKIDAIQFAKSVNSNVFEVTDTLVHSCDSVFSRKGHFKARTEQYNPRYYADGDLNVLIKSVTDAYYDKNVREIIINLDRI